MNTKQKGNIGVGIAIAYFTSKGYTVSIPINDSQEYDLIVDIDKFIYTVQVKYTTETKESGNFTVGLRSISGSSKAVYKRLVDSGIDYLFIVTKNFETYMIPVSDIEQTTSITITDDVKTKYGIVGEWLKPISC